MSLVTLLPQILLVLGVGFLVANSASRWSCSAGGAGGGGAAGLAGAQAAVLRLEPGHWRRAGLLLLFKAWFSCGPPTQLFGELMMFVYYGYCCRSRADHARASTPTASGPTRGFMPYPQIGGITWREGGDADADGDSRLPRRGAPAGGAGDSARRGPPAPARQDQQPRHRDGRGPGAAPWRARRPRQRRRQFV